MGFERTSGQSSTINRQSVTDTKIAAAQPQYGSDDFFRLAACMAPGCSYNSPSQRLQLTVAVRAEIRWFVHWQAPPLSHCSAPHYAVRTRDAGQDSCRQSRLLFVRELP